MLFQKGKGLWIIAVLAIAISGIVPVFANTSHQVSVTIPEVFRYRIENTQVKQIATGEYIQEVAVSVLSNSQRVWNLTADPEAVAGLVEWSTDGQQWTACNDRNHVVLQGTKSTWNVYKFFLKFKGNQSQPLVVNYQVLYNN